MKMYKAIKDEYVISTDKRKLDIQFIHNYLSNESYWAKNIPVETVIRSIEGSFCFGLYIHAKENKFTLTQIGFARVVTDLATFGYLADVFVIDKFRKRGLAKWLMREIMNNRELQGLRRWMLATRDAHTLYAEFGFLPLDNPERIMAFKPFEEYPKNIS